MLLFSVVGKQNEPVRVLQANWLFLFQRQKNSDFDENDAAEPVVVSPLTERTAAML